MRRNTSRALLVASALLLAACSDNDDKVVETPPPEPPAPTAIQDMFGTAFSTAFKADPLKAEPIDVNVGDLPEVSLTADPKDF